MLDVAVQAWVEDVTGGRVVGARQLDRWRPNFFVDVDGPTGELSLFLKGPRVPPHVEVRSRMLSGYGTRRESVALAALQDTAVPVPRLHGFLPAAGALLIGRIPGSGVLQPAPPEVRATLMREYGEQLAATHRLDPQRLGVRPGLDVAADPAGPDRPGPLAAVMADYDVLRPKLERPDPLIELALWWLAHHAPATVEACLLHGDAGPNQFMHDGGHITALLDWELAHLGHPMSDLGYSRFRESLYPSGGFAGFVEAYAAASDRPVERAAVDYFTVAAGLVMLAGISSDVQRPKAHNPEALQRFWWDALARVAICQVLAESRGHPPLVPQPGEQRTGELTALAGLLTDMQEGPAHLLASTLLRASRLQLDVTDTSALLGRHVDDPHAEVTALVRDHAAERLDDLVRYFGEQSLRRLDAMAPLAQTDTWDGAPTPPQRTGPLLPDF
ncbi:phosphotransferase family protein [Pseudonocardia sp. GCM10023141]|uniref:phosphotransferase family protein n=1 Tax=Pseudonocardia sp. GCM10023141 TaxID=3252653 RepID=UPI0036223AFF